MLAWNSSCVRLYLVNLKESKLLPLKVVCKNGGTSGINVFCGVLLTLWTVLCLYSYFFSMLTCITEAVNLARHRKFTGWRQAYLNETSELWFDSSQNSVNVMKQHVTQIMWWLCVSFLGNVTFARYSNNFHMNSSYVFKSARIPNLQKFDFEI